MLLNEIQIWDTLQSKIDRIGLQLSQLHHIRINTKEGYEDNITDKRLKRKLNELLMEQFDNDECWSFSKKEVRKVINELINDLEKRKNRFENRLAYIEEHFKKPNIKQKNIKLRIPLNVKDKMDLKLKRSIIVNLYQILSQKITPKFISCKKEEFLSIFDYKNDLLNSVSLINNKKILWERSEKEFVALFRELANKEIIAGDFFTKHKGNMTLSLLFEKLDDRFKHVSFNPNQLRKDAPQLFTKPIKKAIDEIFLNLSK